MIFCSSPPRGTISRIRGRAVKALRSGRSQLCWRGFESHRMQHLLCFNIDPKIFSIGLAVVAGWLVPTSLQRAVAGGVSVCFMALTNLAVELKGSISVCVWVSDSTISTVMRRGHANRLCIVPILSYVTGVTPLVHSKRRVRLHFRAHRPCGSMDRAPDF